MVENVTGAGGIVGVTRVINAAPDGYTLLLGTVGTHVPAFELQIGARAGLSDGIRSDTVVKAADGAAL